MGEGEHIDLMMEHAPKSRVKVLQNIVKLWKKANQEL